MSDYLKKHCEELIDEYKKSDAEKRQEIFPKIKTFYDFIENYDEEVKKHFDSVFSEIVFAETPKNNNENDYYRSNYNYLDQFVASFDYNISEILENETPENNFKLKYLLNIDEFFDSGNSFFYKNVILRNAINRNNNHEIKIIKNTFDNSIDFGDYFWLIFPDVRHINKSDRIEYEKELIRILDNNSTESSYELQWWTGSSYKNDYFKRKRGRSLEEINQYIKNHYPLLKKKVVFEGSMLVQADKGMLTQKNNLYIDILLANKNEIKDNFLELFDKESELGEYECLTVSFVNHLIEDYYSYKDILLEKHIDILKNYTFILSNVENQWGLKEEHGFPSTFDPNVLIPFIEIAKRDFNSIETTNEINNIINELANYYINCVNENYIMENAVFEDNIDYEISIEVLKQLCEINDRDYCEVLDYMAELDPSFKNTPEYEQEYVGQQLKHF